MNILAFIRKEQEYFARLSASERQLLISYFLYALAAPLVTTYSNTYLWRQSESPVVLAVFNIGYFAGVCVGFWLNAFLLRKFSASGLYAVGCVTQGLVPFLLVSLGAASVGYAPFLGVLLGVAAGLFWGNRNLLTSKTTQSQHRYFFVTLEGIFDAFANIVAPLGIGFFIIYGSVHGFTTIDNAYRIVAGIGVTVMALAGVIVMHSRVGQESADGGRMRVRHVTKRWHMLRRLDFFNGFISGVEGLLPLVFILLFVGQEDAVGGVKTFASLLSVVLVYSVVSHVTHRRYTVILTFWILCSVFSAIAMGLFFGAPGVLVYALLNGVSAPFRWTAVKAILFESIDCEVKKVPSQRFSFLLDREVCLNAGRICALLMMVYLYQQFPDALLQHGLWLIVLAQLPLLFFARRLVVSLWGKR